MERNISDKSGGIFTGINGSRTSSPRSPHSPMANHPSNGHHHRGGSNVEAGDNDSSFPDQDLQIDQQVLEQIDQFVERISGIEDRSCIPEVPDAVETLSKFVESRIEIYNAGEDLVKFGKRMEEDLFFLEAVRRIWKLTDVFAEFVSNCTNSPSLNRTSLVLQRAMAFLEEEFRSLLEDFPRISRLNSKNLSPKQSSLNNKHEEIDHCLFPDRKLNENEEEEFPRYTPEDISNMNRIATAMISAGYVTECSQAYAVARRNAFEEELRRMEFEKVNMEDVQKMSWDSLEGEVSRWIKVIKHCSGVLFPGESKLGKSVFSDHPSISRSLFSNLARTVVIQLLDFAEAVAMTRRSAEKLFKFLDIYETLRQLIPSIDSDDCEHGLKSEINATCDRFGDAAMNIFCDLENSIRSDVAKTPVPGGAVHPLTRYVMNYLKYASEYRETLDQIFKKLVELDPTPPLGQNKAGTESESPRNRDDETMADTSPFSAQLMLVMDLLHSNLEEKSRLYKDLSLRYIFLMNNGRYIIQKVKGSEIHHVVGDNWYRKKSTVVRQFHKNYQRETWGRLLQCLGQEGLQVNGKVYKPVLKERFKNFTVMFDDIHKTQSTWVVSDEQLLSELRVSVSAVVVPAYRSFLGRFRQYLDSGRQAEKYIKYQPEDIETLIEELFDGNPMSMARRRN